MNGVTCPVWGLTVTMRELLFCAPTARMAWFESVAKSRPPSKPFSNAMSIAGPCSWRPMPLVVGLARGPRIRFPLWSNTRMSGVKGLVADNSPPTTALVSSLHRLGRPCPDSSTNTSKRSLLPRNATAVGKFRLLLKTETVKPGGTTIFSPLPGLKKTSSPGQSGFARVWAVASVGRVSTSANETVSQLNRSNRLRMSTPSQRYPAFFARTFFTWRLQGYAACIHVCRSPWLRWPRGHDASPFLKRTARRCVIVHQENTQGARVNHQLRYGSVRYPTIARPASRRSTKSVSAFDEGSSSINPRYERVRMQRKQKCVSSRRRDRSPEYERGCARSCASSPRPPIGCPPTAVRRP